jgi:hypothetical protein
MRIIFLNLNYTCTIFVKKILSENIQCTIFKKLLSQILWFNNNYYNTMITCSLFQMRTFAIQDKTEQSFAAYTGKGVVYNVVVSQRNRTTGTTTAVYIPVTSYGCHGDGVQCTDLDQCQ